MTTITAYRWGKPLFFWLWVLGLSGLVAVAAQLLPTHPLLWGAVVLLLCLSIALGALNQRCGFFARPVIRVDGVDGLCSLTFDDGPDEEFTPQILELLARHGQRATFFVIGDKAARHPELMKQMVDEGHEVGNHTMSHSWHMALRSEARVIGEIERASDLVERLTGSRPRLFRPPAAILSPRIDAGVHATGLQLVGYSVRSGDGSPAISADHALRRLTRGLRPGAIFVLHDTRVAGNPPSALTVLPALCEAMDRAGLRSVPVSELMGRSGEATEVPGGDS